ncbi:MAG TPA: hypothetical protein VKA54_23450 [Gemmatimonadaceae bacterium]|nr:hypothetical protein [Gemmatimonadaceae bacterium]
MSQLAHTHPRRATEIVDASFRFYRAHFGDLLVVSALLLVPPVLITAIVPQSMQVVFQVIGNLMYLVCQGAIAVHVAAALEQDRALSAGETLRALGDRAGSVIAVAIMSGLLIGLGTLLLVIPGIIAAVWTMVATPVAAIEGRRNSDALGRSRELARGQFWHVLGTTLLVWAIVIALMIGAAIALGLVFGLFGLPDRITDMVGELAMVPLFPLIGVAVAMLYYDLRVRSEGADVQAMVEALPELQ